MKIRQTIAALAVALATLGVNGAYASDIIYTVDQIIGPGSVTGTITTNGTIGILSAADIVSLNLTLNDGSNIANLSSLGGGGTHSGADLTASPRNLMFNYSGVDSGYFDPSSSNGALCYTSTSNCWGPTGVGVFNVGGDGRSVFIGQSGNQIIATAVPEPATWAMMLLGVGMVAAGLRFNRRRNGMALATA